MNGQPENVASRGGMGGIERCSAGQAKEVTLCISMIAG
jgi:hypothetical protein